jgi:hypothetical protein
MSKRTSLRVVGDPVTAAGGAREDRDVPPESSNAKAPAKDSASPKSEFPAQRSPHAKNLLTQNEPARMMPRIPGPIPLHHSLPAALAATLLLWKPTFVVFFPNFVYTSDLTTVHLHDACIGGTTQTVFVFCLLEVLTACVLLKNYVVPALFGRKTWQEFAGNGGLSDSLKDSGGSLKQRKMVGFAVKILVRASCGLQIAALVAPQVSLQHGMFGGRFNMKKANAELVEKGRATTCAEAGMTLTDAVAMRAWTFVRDNLMAVMVRSFSLISQE